VAQLPSNPQWIIAKKSVPATNLKELVMWLKLNADKVSAGTAGPGSASHVAGVYFQNITGTHFPFVPYRGTGPALNDLIAGQIDLIVDQTSNSMAQVKAGSVKAFAVTAKERLPSAPNIPTVDEAGAPGLYISVWYGLWVPKGTPREVIAKLNAAAVDAMADPTVQARMTTFGLEIPPREQQTPEALGALQKAEIEKWWPIIKAAHITGE
jgi:tripartite-type tricarboxylate transporter receptor subunit TctC